MAASRCDGISSVCGCGCVRTRSVPILVLYGSTALCGTILSYQLSNSLSGFFSSCVMLYLISLHITVNESRSRSFESSSYFSSLSSPLVWPSCGRGRIVVDSFE